MSILKSPAWATRCCAAARVPRSVEVRAAVMQKFIDDMIDTMLEYHGVGLAAPQVHEGVRVFVARIDRRDGRRRECEPIAFINPEITPVGEREVEDWEGCLSIPDIRGRVPRARDIKVHALDRKGEPIELRRQDFPARVIQHETDHLDGVLFFDRMRKFDSLTYLDEYSRYPPQRQGRRGGRVAVPYHAEVLLDSVNPTGQRLTTFVLRFPRFVLSEFNTHRMFSRNASSSRAIPTTKLMQQLREDPVMPVEWGRNQSGMQAREVLDADAGRAAEAAWLGARDAALAHAEQLRTDRHPQADRQPCPRALDVGERDRVVDDLRQFLHAPLPPGRAAGDQAAGRPDACRIRGVRACAPRSR